MVALALVRRRVAGVGDEFVYEDDARADALEQRVQLLAGGGDARVYRGLDESVGFVAPELSSHLAPKRPARGIELRAVQNGDVRVGRVVGIDAGVGEDARWSRCCRKRKKALRLR